MPERQPGRPLFRTQRGTTLLRAFEIVDQAGAFQASVLSDSPSNPLALAVRKKSRSKGTSSVYWYVLWSETPSFIAEISHMRET